MDQVRVAIAIVLLDALAGLLAIQAQAEENKVSNLFWPVSSNLFTSCCVVSSGPQYKALEHGQINLSTMSICYREKKVLYIFNPSDSITII